MTPYSTRCGMGVPSREGGRQDPVPRGYGSWHPVYWSRSLHPSLVSPES